MKLKNSKNSFLTTKKWIKKNKLCKSTVPTIKHTIKNIIVRRCMFFFSLKDYVKHF